MKLYKLVTQEWTTRGGMKWAIGQTNEVTGDGVALCSGDVLHAYTCPLLAMLLNPIHAEIINPILLEVETGPIVAHDKGLKVGVKTMTPVSVLPLPEITVENRVAFGIYCALEVCKNEKFVKWANDWLSGEDRTAGAAREAEWAAEAAEWAAGAAEWAAEAAAGAAKWTAEDAGIDINKCAVMAMEIR